MIIANFTSEPWQWVVSPSGSIRLATPNRGGLYVMTFARQGMQQAQPRFSSWGDGPRESRGGIMRNFLDAGGAGHPDARVIAAAPSLATALQKILETTTDIESRRLAQFALDRASLITRERA